MPSKLYKSRSGRYFKTLKEAVKDNKYYLRNSTYRKYANENRAIDLNEFFGDISNNRNRAINIEHLQQFDDSLLARGYADPQRFAFLATSAQEMNEDGAASRGVGGNGLLGYNEYRMPLSYLGSTKEEVGNQIHYLLDDVERRHKDNWLDGGPGGPTIRNGKEGFDSFWNNNDVRKATVYLNKSNIRPRDREEAWNNRADIAENLYKYYKRRLSSGGKKSK